MANINKKIAVILFLATIMLSLLSQLPAVLDSGADKIFKLVWILPFGFLLATSPHLFISNKLLPFYLFVFTITLYCFACQMATGNLYLGSDINNIAICLLVTIVSYIFWQQYGNDSIIKGLCIIMIVGGALLALQVYSGYLRDADITSNSYAYDAKNSVAQILLCCGFIILLLFSPNNKNIFIAGRIIAISILVVMVMTRSRATLLSAFYIVYYYTFRYGNKKLKTGIIILAILAVVLILLYPNIYDVIVQGILFGGRDSSDVNSLSSGRIFFFALALQKIPQSPWIGSGDYYVDCMPLNIMTEFGIIGLVMVLSFIAYIFAYLKKKQKKDKIHNAAYVLFISFLVNSIFEAQPPFGPGMKCFILWMFIGFSLANSPDKLPKTAT